MKEIDQKWIDRITEPFEPDKDEKRDERNTIRGLLDSMEYLLVEIKGNMGYPISDRGRDQIREFVPKLRETIQNLEKITGPADETLPPEDLMKKMLEIGERLRTQDNRCTADPLFCVQVLKADVGYDSEFSDNHCWSNFETMDTVFDKPPKGSDEYVEPKKEKGVDAEKEKTEEEEEEDENSEAFSSWVKTGYVTRWETVMVSFTELGCQEHLDLNGHNYRYAHEGRVRIYAHHIHRCPEMINIRNFLMALGQPPKEVE